MRIPMYRLALCAIAVSVVACHDRAPPAYVDPELSIVVTGPGEVRVEGVASCDRACTYQVLSGATLVLEAVPDVGASFSGWDSCPDERGATCEITVSFDSTVGARFVTTADTGPEVGSVRVSFTGLPTPWSGQGLGVLTAQESPAAAVSVVESGVIEGLSPGRYVLEALPLPLCGVEYVPDAAAAEITVVAGATVDFSVAYGAGSVERLGYRARVTGVHSVVSITEELEMEATLMLVGQRVKTFACIRYLELDDFEQGPVSDADLRLGNAADFFVYGGQVMATLDVAAQPCEPVTLPAGPGSSCTVYLDGLHLLSDEHRSGVTSGNAFLRAAVPAARMGALLAAAPGDGVAPLEGGTLLIEIDDSLSVEVCLEGPLEAPLPATLCLAETTSLANQLTGTYTLLSIDGGPPDDAAFLVDGDPATVVPGETVTIRVELRFTTF